MTIFTYGIEKSLLEVLQHYFGEAEYFDVTEQYQDILALCADVVVISEANCSDDVLKIIREFEEETKDMDDTLYIYLATKQQLSVVNTYNTCFGKEKRLWYLQWILTEH